MDLKILCDLILNTTETPDSWKSIDEALEKISSSLPDYSSEVILHFMKLIKEPLISCITSDRTKLSGTASQLLKNVAEQLQRDFEPLIESYFPALMKLLGRSNKVFVQRAMETLDIIVSTSTNKKIYGKLLDGLSNTNKYYRISISQLMLKFVEHMEPLHFDCESIEKFISISVNDATPEVRENGRKVFAIYLRVYRDKALRLCNTLPSNSQKYLKLQAKEKENTSATIAHLKHLSSFKNLFSEEQKTHGLKSVLEEPKKSPIVNRTMILDFKKSAKTEIASLKFTSDDSDKKSFSGIRSSGISGVKGFRENLRQIKPTQEKEKPVDPFVKTNGVDSQAKTATIKSSRQLPKSLLSSGKTLKLDHASTATTSATNSTCPTTTYQHPAVATHKPVSDNVEKHDRLGPKKRSVEVHPAIPKKSKPSSFQESDILKQVESSDWDKRLLAYQSLVNYLQVESKESISVIDRKWISLIYSGLKDPNIKICTFLLNSIKSLLTSGHSEIFSTEELLHNIIEFPLKDKTSIANTYAEVIKAIDHSTDASAYLNALFSIGDHVESTRTKSHVLSLLMDKLPTIVMSDEEMKKCILFVSKLVVEPTLKFKLSAFVKALNSSDSTCFATIFNALNESERRKWKYLMKGLLDHEFFIQNASTTKDKSTNTQEKVPENIFVANISKDIVDTAIDKISTEEFARDILLNTVIEPLYEKIARSELKSNDCVKRLPEENIDQRVEENVVVAKEEDINSVEEVVKASLLEAVEEIMTNVVKEQAADDRVNSANQNELSSVQHTVTQYLMDALDYALLCTDEHEECEENPAIKLNGHPTDELPKIEVTRSPASSLNSSNAENVDIENIRPSNENNVELPAQRKLKELELKQPEIAEKKTPEDQTVAQEDFVIKYDVQNPDLEEGEIEESFELEEGEILEDFQTEKVSTESIAKLLLDEIIYKSVKLMESPSATQLLEKMNDQTECSTESLNDESQVIDEICWALDDIGIQETSAKELSNSIVQEIIQEEISKLVSEKVSIETNDQLKLQAF